MYCEYYFYILNYTNLIKGEHGVGLGKKDSLLKELGPTTIDVMRSIKRSLDPHWLLNPGKLFDFADVSQ
jgi:D-lactate dehydrogenase (cytochrome)